MQKGRQYRCEAIRELADQQVRFAPLSVRLDQIARTEELILSLTDSDIPYQKLTEQITRYRSGLFPDLTISRSDALHDLRLFLEDLSRNALQPVSGHDETVLTLTEVSRRLNVALKTVNRWRDQGLPSRFFRFADGVRLGITEAALQRFAANSAPAVARGSAFSQLSEDEQESILRRARRLAQAGAGQTEIIRRVARFSGRAAETVRTLLKRYDSQHPDSAVLPARRQITDTERKAIYQAVQRGESPTEIGRHFGRSRSSIHQIARSFHAQLLQSHPVRFIPGPDFNRDETLTEILSEPLAEILTRFGLNNVPSKPDEPLTPEAERILFRRLNFLLFLADRTRQQWGQKQNPDIRSIREVERHLAESFQIRNLIVQKNQALVHSVARRHRIPENAYQDAISEANLTLLKTIETFDYSRGNRFATYATWALMRTFARLPAGTYPNQHSPP